HSVTVGGIIQESRAPLSRYTRATSSESASSKIRLLILSLSRMKRSIASTGFSPDFCCTDQDSSCSHPTKSIAVIETIVLLVIRPCNAPMKNARWVIL
ncbi:MAG: hypothetical protein NTV56_01005, partial [Alphaproteobacteria bacterium]|nr:hypothetical protein [Alphaproteobacteria bacterium]